MLREAMADGDCGEAQHHRQSDIYQGPSPGVGTDQVEGLETEGGEGGESAADTHHNEEADVIGRGVSAAVLAAPLLGALAVLTFGGLVARLAGPRWAPPAALALALSLPEQFTSRSTYSEPAAQIRACIRRAATSGPITS